jgi:hypothetical protein
MALVDGEMNEGDLEVTGIGEYRVALPELVNPVTFDLLDVDTGRPLPVPAEGALANYGFEMPLVIDGIANWVVTGTGGTTTDTAYEGEASLQLQAGATASQMIPLVNIDEYTPEVTILSVAYKGAGGVIELEAIKADGTPYVGTLPSWSVGPSVGGTWWTGSFTAVLDPEIDQIKVILSGVGYWDDVQVSIQLLDEFNEPSEEVRTVFTAAKQGITTNYLFAVDRDNNRPGDRLASTGEVFYIAYDITKPTLVGQANTTRVKTSTLNVDDPTSQFDISWSSANAPDDVGNVESGYDSSVTYPLSPWYSYKIYYGTYNSGEVPLAEVEAAMNESYYPEEDKYVYANFVATGEYLTWDFVCVTNIPQDPTATLSYYSDTLSDVETTGFRLYDLDYDQDYAVVVVGVDSAGNEGPADEYSWAADNTIRFAVTQGVMKAWSSIPAEYTNKLSSLPKQKWDEVGPAALYWTAASNAMGNVTREYDLLYWDSYIFDEVSNNVWTNVTFVQSNWFVDASGLTNAQGNLRFYRASYKDRWRRELTSGTNVVTQIPQVSEEIWAMNNVKLSPGNNFVSLHGVPYTNTLYGIFGADSEIWPSSGYMPVFNLNVQFYPPDPDNATIHAADVYYLIDGDWYQVAYTNEMIDGTNYVYQYEKTVPEDEELPTEYQYGGFNIWLPSTNWWPEETTQIDALGKPYMTWRPILQVPTNNAHWTNITVYGGTIQLPGYTLISAGLPTRMTPTQLFGSPPVSGFRTATLAALRTMADQVFTIDPHTGILRQESGIYYLAGQGWRYASGTGTTPVPSDFTFAPNEGIVIVTHQAGSWIWSTTHRPIPYTLPDRRRGY